ncbi:uncharacterized protein METZ01_LOCUS101991 [marine metagenome]|uniref:Uncharacterized protein n=1 Tax=marine metagenome TaxID=408172 RepID=A0A381WB14_9ZZZZ
MDYNNVKTLYTLILLFLIEFMIIVLSLYKISY